MYFGMTLYEICWYFVLYSLIGWCLEVVYHAVSLGKVVNRGFLNGPVCPVYGFGMVGLLAVVNTAGAALAPAGEDRAGSLIFLFLAGMCLATAVELLAGWGLDMIFHARWWDYSDEPFNFHGYICLKFSLLWGLGAVLVVRLVHPLVAGGIPSLLPLSWGWPLCGVCYVIFLTDTGLTVAGIIGMNKRLEELEKLRRSMRTVSDGMTEVLADSAIRTQNAVAETRIQGALARAEIREAAAEKKAALEEAREQRAALTAEKRRGLQEEMEKRAAALKAELLKPGASVVRRIHAAFPDYRSRDYGEILEEIGRELEEGRKSA